MEYETQTVGITPRLIIHGGAGNIQREGYPADKYDEYRTALLTMVRPPPPLLHRCMKASSPTSHRSATPTPT